MMRGGEIFVPKIPSMRLAELVEALAPGMQDRLRRRASRRKAA